MVEILSSNVFWTGAGVAVAIVIGLFGGYRYVVSRPRIIVDIAPGKYAIEVKLQDIFTKFIALKDCVKELGYYNYDKGDADELAEYKQRAFATLRALEDDVYTHNYALTTERAELYDVKIANPGMKTVTNIEIKGSNILAVNIQKNGNSRWDNADVGIVTESLKPSDEFFLRIWVTPGFGKEIQVLHDNAKAKVIRRRLNRTFGEFLLEHRLEVIIYSCVLVYFLLWIYGQ